MALLHSSASFCLQLSCECNHLTRPLCSSRITSLHRYYGSVRPSAPHRYFRLVVSATCAFPFTSGRLVPAVPHGSLDQGHASSTPAAACPVIRCPTGLSQESLTLLVSTTIGVLRRVNGGSLSFVSLFLTCLGYLPIALPPTLTTTALDRSSLGWFGACSLKTDSEGPPFIFRAALCRVGQLTIHLLSAPPLRLRHTQTPALDT